MSYKFQFWIYNLAQGGSFVPQPNLADDVLSSACSTVKTSSRGLEVIVFGGTGTLTRDKTLVYNINSGTWSNGTMNIYDNLKMYLKITVDEIYTKFLLSFPFKAVQWLWV